MINLKLFSRLTNIKLFKNKLFRTVAGYSVGGAAIFVVLSYKLGKLMPLLSPDERHTRIASASGSIIWSDPINAPYKLIQWGLTNLGLDSVRGFRLVSVVLSVFTALLFFKLVKSWHGKRVALLGTTLFVTSAWFLHVARSATPDAMFPLLSICILLYGMWLKKSRNFNWIVFFSALIASFFIFVPGFIILLLSGIIWKRKVILYALSTSNMPIKLLVTIIGLISLSTLALMISSNPPSMREFIGVNQSSLVSIKDFVVNILLLPVRIFLKGPYSPTEWLSQTPLLTFVVSAFAFVGVHALSLRWKLSRVKLLAGFFVICWAMISLAGTVDYAILLPLMFLLASTGLAKLMQLWLKVFPKNPMARILGVSIVFFLVILSVFYSYNNYFLAWPNSPETNKAYTQQQ